MSGGPLPSALRPLTVPASRVYAAIIAARNRRYDRGQGVQRVDRPVISVGNITTGGTGKTPMVMWIARQLLQADHHPAIAMRGYMARSNAPSDEQAEYHQAVPDVPVIANPDRVAALRDFLPSHREIDAVILDDGFQHRRLHRDLDLVLIDAQARTLYDDMLPAGHLREPLSSLARADAVIITRTASIDPVLRGEIERWHGRPPIAWTRHAWRSLLVDRGSWRTDADATSAESHVARDWLAGKRVVSMLGVGNPQSIVGQAEALGAKVIARIPAVDHQQYDRARLITARGLCDGADGLLVTRKDWMKIKPLMTAGRVGEWSIPFIVPQVEIEFIAGEDDLRKSIVECVAKSGPRTNT